MNVAEAQRLGNEGSGVTVAVIDSGIDAAHPDLTGVVSPGADFATPGGGDGRVDANGHGTGMAGLIAGHGHGNAAGALGIAPKAQIVPVRIQAIAPSFGDEENQGIIWAAQHGVKVICIAVGKTADDVRMRRAVEQAQAADVVVVAAAGNRPRDTKVIYPAAYPGVIAAVGVDQQGNHSDVSVTGPEVSLAAPAADVVTTAPNNKYSKGSGSSNATAIVAGVATLVRAKYPNLTAPEVIHRLTATATDKGAPGRDNEYGFGIVNPVAALTADVPPLTPSAAPSSATGVAPVATPPVVAQPSRPNRTPLVIALIVAGLLVVAGTATAITIVVRRNNN
nr:S8 family serine peptidase [Planosporangium flavigriseum]